MCLLCTAAGAEDWDGRRHFGWGKQEISLAGSYAIGFGAFGSEGTDAADVEFAGLLPNWGIGISDALGDSFYRGSFSFHIEPQMLWNHEPQNGDAYGGGILIRYNLLTQRRFVPFIEGGTGFMSVDFDLFNQRDGFNFLLQGGVGAHFFLTDRAALLAGWRYHHMSNAGTRHPNVGINSNLFQFGATYYFD
jgi:lipid A 3-O-deacylase